MDRVALFNFFGVLKLFFKCCQIFSLKYKLTAKKNIIKFVEISKMQEESVISSLSNMSFINSANNSKCHDFLGKNFDLNILGETYRGSEAR